MRSIYATICGDHYSGRGGRFDGRGHRRGRGGISVQGRGVHVIGGRGGGSGAYLNGIDISDVTCYFEDSEWVTLSNDTSKRITENPVRTKFLKNKIGAPPALPVLKKITRIG